MKQDDIKSLQISLPEDILKAKWCGDFERALRLIDRAIQSEKTPKFLKQRLAVEKEIIERLPLSYSYSVEDAVALVQKEIPDFSKEELEKWMDEGAIDWIYVQGKPCLATRFFETLKDVQPSIARRAGIVDESFEETPGTRLRNQMIQDMKSSKEVTYRVRLRTGIEIGEKAFTKGKVLVHMPIPKPQINQTNIQILSTFPKNGETCKVTIGAEDQPQRTVSFEEDMTENHPFEVEYEYDITAKYHDLSAPVEEQAPRDPADERFLVKEEDLQEIPPHVMFTPTMRALAEELTKGLTTPMEKARAFYDFVTTRITYSYMRQYFTLEQIPEYAVTGLKGDCGVQALTFITLCRLTGIPARWQSALYVTPRVNGENEELLEEFSAGMHDWAMFYVEPYGWLFADVSFGGSAYRSGNLERWNHYFGNLDPFRMAANDAFQAALIPEKHQTRFDPYDNQVGDIEYEDHPVSRDDVIITKTVLEFNRIR